MRLGSNIALPVYHTWEQNLSAVGGADKKRMNNIYIYRYSVFSETIEHNSIHFWLLLLYLAKIFSISFLVKITCLSVTFFLKKILLFKKLLNYCTIILYLFQTINPLATRTCCLILNLLPSVFENRNFSVVESGKCSD